MPAIKGEKILCLGITEPDAGSDVAGIKTRAVRDGDEYVINGSKTYITNGHRADVIVLVTKTDPDAGYDGFTLFLVPMDAPGVIREKKLEKLGMHASDTALLAFQDVRVPDIGGARPGRQGLLPHHVGAPGRAPDRRRGLRRGRPALLRPARCSTRRSARRSAARSASSRSSATSSPRWRRRSRRRARWSTRPPGASRTASTRCARSRWPSCYASRIAVEVADECIQIHGGAGYMKEYGVERVWRDMRLNRIGAGTDEIMLDVIGRSYGLCELSAGCLMVCSDRLHARRSPTPTPSTARRSTSAAACTTAQVDQGAVVQVPLAMMNRHGLVAGATGTGKTKTLQGIAEQLSAAGRAGLRRRRQGRPVAASRRRATPSGGRREARRRELGMPFAPTAFPVEFLSLGGIGPGVPVRATVSDFGPQLLAKVLGANETQEQSLDARLPLRRRQGPAAARPVRPARAADRSWTPTRARPSSRASAGCRRATVGVLLRALVGLEDGGGNEFFGEPQLDVDDLLRTAPDGRGVISLPRAARRPGQAGAVSTALMWLARRAVRGAARGGRPGQAQARLLLRRGPPAVRRAPPKAFLASVEQTVRLIRSKGVGVFFVTQTPKDVPGDVLGAARQPRAARAARLHARRRQGAEGDRLDVPEVRVLRPGGAAHRSWASARRP